MLESKISQYKNYSVTDFVWDEHFIAWCKNRPEADPELWKNVLEMYPELEETIADARDFLLQVTIKDQLPSAEQLQKMWQRIENELPQDRPTGGLVRKLRGLQVAAIMLLTAGVGVFAYYTTPKDEKISTQYAEIKKLELPDHSAITLNANSAIRYAKEWDASKPREVWLTGEAYFEIAHLHKGPAPVKPGERFIVHTPGVDVEVLGTSFNVNSRNGAAQITLTSGSIELKFADKKLNKILMKPGDLVKYSKVSRKIEKQTANPVTASAWKEHRWEFDNTSLKEVLQLLKDNYGLEAKVEDPALWNKTLSGTISSDDTELLVKGLSVLLNIQIEQKGKTLLLKN
jgi:ferric-dicitrate binding protein FerR (iron transport regulator)